MQQGRIRNFVAERGFGFIIGAGNNGDVIFFHVSSAADIPELDIVPGLCVSYEVSEHRGRPCAINVRLA